jgi:hypothetical protein
VWQKKHKDYLHFTEKNFKVERMQAQETLLGCLQCLESEVEKRVWHQDSWMLPWVFWGQKYAEILLNLQKPAKNNKLFLLEIAKMTWKIILWLHNNINY